MDPWMAWIHRWPRTDRTEVMLFGSPSCGLHAVGDLAYEVAFRCVCLVLIYPAVDVTPGAFHDTNRQGWIKIDDTDRCN